MDIAAVDRGVAVRVQEAMTGADATILGVATATGIPFTTLHRHLKRGGFTIPELYLIAEHLNIQVTDLMVTAAA